MAGKQIEFPPKQTHVRSFEVALLVICLICVAVVLIIVLGTGLGDEFRPTNCAARNTLRAWRTRAMPATNRASRRPAAGCPRGRASL